MAKRRKSLSIAMVGILSAMAFVFVAFGRVPVVMFLKYDPKDVVITLGGLLLGPLNAVLVSIITGFIEMVTISDTGWIGLMMNVLATLTFALPAAVVYRKRHNLMGAVVGLFFGVVLMTITMILWNYIITPIYLGIPRAEVVKLLVPAIMPFNLLKGGLNAAFVFLLYKPISKALKKYIPVISEEKKEKGSYALALRIVALGIIVTCVMIILSYQGII